MEERIIRFKTSPRIAHKKHTFLPRSKYYNKLYNSLSLFTKSKNLLMKIGSESWNDPRNEELTKNDINDVFIKTQCKLYELPIKLYGNRFVETDYLEPYWDEFGSDKAPKYVLISKEYLLVEKNEYVNVLELKNYDAFKKGQKVKIHQITLPKDYEIIYE